MESLLVNVCVAENIWDQFVVMYDKVLFISQNDKYHVELIEENLDRKNVVANQIVSIVNTLNSTVNASNHSQHVDSILECSHPEGCLCTNHKKKKAQHNNTLKLYMDGYLLSVFVNILRSSVFYRSTVINHFKLCKQLKGSRDSLIRVTVKLKYPLHDVIDYSWNERMEKISVVQRELDNAMSWLSTLGGAFSALGDTIEHCAEMAGRISIRQLSIAMQLGDPLTVARCKLYLSLSLLQRGYLRRARFLIEDQYRLAHSLPVIDTRLIRMCLGIWAKLKYMHRLKREAKKRSVTRSL